MKTKIIRILQTIFAIAAFGFAIYGEDSVCRGFGMGVGITFICIGFIFENRYDQLEHFFCVIGCIIYFFFFIGIAMELHIKESDEGVDVLSPFYTHVLEHGERGEQMKLHSHYLQYDSGIEVKTESFFFLYGGNGTKCSVYNSYEKIMTLPASFVITEKDFGYGNLHYIQIGDNAYDMTGKEIKDGYQPEIIGLTIDYSNYANL